MARIKLSKEIERVFSSSQFHLFIPPLFIVLSLYMASPLLNSSLGMEHDGTRNECPQSGHLMASDSSSGPGAFMWSKCSAAYLHKFLKYVTGRGESK